MDIEAKDDTEDAEASRRASTKEHQKQMACL
jgi:hypothetical protein